MSQSPNELQEAKLQDIKGLRPECEFQGIPRGKYTAEFAVRSRDNAVVVHIYPKIQGGKYAPWDEHMGDALKAAIEKVFDIDRVTAGFEESQNSFYIIAGGYGAVLDPRKLFERFLSALDAALES